MHELSITQSILNIVNEHAQRAGAASVTAIHLTVGELTGFIDDSLQFYFEMLSPGTPAEGATLNIIRVPAVVRCRSCGFEFHLEGLQWTCPRCQTIGGDVLRGREFQVDSIEVVQETLSPPGGTP